ncbi:MAG: tyrosine-protein phosphatase [Pseudomonadota bacterium]
MGSFIKRQFRKFERTLTEKLGRDISTPQARRRAMWHFNLIDHAFLRTFWWNLEEIAPDVWRSNQPSPKRVAHYHSMGIRSIINLRGSSYQSPYLLEQDACATHGIAMHDVEMSARKLVARAVLQKLLATMRSVERPFLMHCKSGSDRAGFASVLYLAILEGRPLAEARKHLHWKYLHLSTTDTGILDFVLDTYEAETQDSGMDLETWINTCYDPEAITAAWKAKRGEA